ncbi:prephenate dehydrogenase [Vulgatibacter sp.]|uniref:prephenate dehydrogenase n=1 Tax=Vulgatibacter sp. TaxID=1971226 RepID=UPI0035688895
MNVTPPEPPYGVIGLGLVGGSLARALARSLPEARLVVVEPDPSARAAALRDRISKDALEAPGPLLSECNLIFLCVPTTELPGLLPQLAPHLRPDAILADVLPVKASVERMVAEALPDARFVGCHPLVGGRDPTGWSRSRPDLFVGRPVALCPRDGQESLAAGVGTVWAALGARPVVLPAEEHDRIVAATNHAPYLTALGLARVAAATPGAERLVGRGLEEALRLAGSAPEILATAVAANPFAPAVIRVLADELVRLADLAENDPAGFEAAAAEAREARARLAPE